MVLLTSTSFTFLGIGVFSMFIHATKKWLMDEVSGKLSDWYLVNPKSTVLAFMTCGGGIATAILSGALTDYNVGAQILAAAGIGYASDTVNTQGKK